ncbi:MAG: GNAT family N-acetyltransferase [Oscillospiraceae bacterium]|nr:GNAT family N-acetyltransferase [Ruminococcus sp.]MCD8344414.1 GNAT family N-acetyltransferase [Oscillospiraceae bacterium]
MSDGVSFVRAAESDRDVFIEMSKEFYSSPAVLSDINPEFHGNVFDEAMRSDCYVVIYVFKSGEDVIGYGLLNKMFAHEAGGLTVWIEELYVRDGYRGSGIGSEFLRFVEKEHPAMRYRLETEPENEAAARLYERLGYQKLDYCQMYKDKQA